MVLLQWWMRLVGVFYLFFAGALLPFGTGPSDPIAGTPFTQQWPQRMEDWQFFFGLEVAVLGIVLLYAAQQPRENLILVWLVVLQELVRGAFGMLYFMSRGAPAIPYGLLAVVHLLIAVAGIDFARRTLRGERTGEVV